MPFESATLSNGFEYPTKLDGKTSVVNGSACAPSTTKKPELLSKFVEAYDELEAYR